MGYGPRLWLKELDEPVHGVRPFCPASLVEGHTSVAVKLISGESPIFHNDVWRKRSDPVRETLDDRCVRPKLLLRSSLVIWSVQCHGLILSFDGGDVAQISNGIDVFVSNPLFVDNAFQCVLEIKQASFLGIGVGQWHVELVLYSRLRKQLFKVPVPLK